MMPKAKTQESQPILDALSQLQRRLEVPFSVSLIVGVAAGIDGAVIAGACSRHC